MAEAASDHSDSKHIVDDVFQYLVRACDIPPATAKKEILEKLQLDKLQADLHVCGGARKILPMRPATEEELQGKKSAGVVMFHVYEFAPSEGITEPVPFQHWDADSVFCLTIRDGHLTIEPNCALDYPWDAYSFTVANWSLVEELWPNPNRAGPALTSKLKDSNASTGGESAKRSVKPWIAYAIEQRHDQLAGLGPEPAGKFLHEWMKAGDFNPEKVVGWKRIKNILTDDAELRGKLSPRKSTRKSKSARKAPGKRPRKTQ